MREYRKTHETHQTIPHDEFIIGKRVKGYKRYKNTIKPLDDLLRWLEEVK